MKTKKIHATIEKLVRTFNQDVTIREITGDIRPAIEEVSIQSGSVQRRFHICSGPLPGPFQAWARDFFNEESHLNTLLDIHAVFNSYKDTLPSPWRDLVRLCNWKKWLEAFCQSAGWELNPPDVHPDKYKASRKEYRWRDGRGRDVYGIYIRAL